jgi:hypothetical protein
MRTNKKIAFVFMIAVLAVPTVYFVLQFQNALAHYEYYSASARAQTESELTAYMISIIDIWAVPLEILAVARIFQSRKSEGASQSHDKMLAILYALQGFGFFATPFWGGIIIFLIPLPPPSEFYYSSIAVGLADIFITALAFSISAVFFLPAYGYVGKREWAQKVGFTLSLLSIFVWSYVEFHLVRAYFYEGLSTTYYLSLIFLFLALVVANIIAVCVVVWRYMISRQTR